MFNKYQQQHHFSSNSISREIKRFQSQLTLQQIKPGRYNRQWAVLDSVQENLPRVDLGENPFLENSNSFKKFDHLQVACEDESRFDIKVFPNSTKAAVERNSIKPTPVKKKNEILHDYRIIPPQGTSQSTTPVLVDLDLESKLFPERSKQEESTVLLDTSKIRKQMMLPEEEHIVQIKLFRKPDKHFYEFIKEYGIIINQPTNCSQKSKPQSPSSARYSSSTTQCLQQSELNFYISELPSTNKSRNASPNGKESSPGRHQLDSSVFSHYFQQQQKRGNLSYQLPQPERKEKSQSLTPKTS